MSERNHHPGAPLGVAVALAAAAGFVDAHIYVNVTPVFVANMSGNLIHMGILLGDGGWRPVIGTLVAIAAFTGGVILATVHHDRRVVRRLPVRPATLLAVEAVLVASLLLWLVVRPTPFAIVPRLADVPVLALGAVAMGMQAAALRRVGEIAVATTYGTGAIVRIGEKVVLAVRRADRSTTHRRRVAIAVLAVVLVAYVAGATAATVAGSSPWLLALPVIALAVCAALTRTSVEVDAPPGP